MAYYNLCIFDLLYNNNLILQEKKIKTPEEERMIQINVSIKKIHLANQFIFLRLNREDLV